MKLKEPKGSIFSKPNVIVILAFVALLALLFLLKFTNVEYDFSSKNEDSTDTPTYFQSTSNIRENVENNINRIYEDDRLSIYTLKENQVPLLAYVYKGPLTEEEKNDKFFLHIFFHNDSLVLAKFKKPFLNLDFTPQSHPAINFAIANEEFTAFKRPLKSSLFNDNIVPFNKIKSINTGRFHVDKRTKVIKNIIVSFTTPIEIENTEFHNLTLTISKKSYEKIRAKRDSAVARGVLITGDSDFVKATVTSKDLNEAKAKIRLKGDWTDHLTHHKKWSYRIIMDGDETLFGMRKLSVQHPKSRNYAWEWLFNRVAKEHDIVGLRYGFANVSVQIKDDPNKINMGIMAIEESFDKILIENNRRREGLILALDESLLWQDRERSLELKLTNTSWSEQLHSFRNANIKVFNENKVLSDPKLTKQLGIAKDLIEGLRTQELKISQAFDLDKLTTFVALANLFGADHGLIWHNLRFYYNPITNKLEPVSFDSNSGQKLIGIIQHPIAGEDEVYHEALVKKLEWVSSESFLNDLLNKNEGELGEIVDYMQREFDFSFDSTILIHNSNFIKKYLDPAVLISSNIINHSATEIEIEVNNLADFPVFVNELRHSDGKLLSKAKAPELLQTHESKRIIFTLDDYFNNAFVSKKNKKVGFNYPKDVEKLRIHHSLIGSDKSEKVAVNAFGKNENIKTSISTYKKQFSHNFRDFDFIGYNWKKKQIRIFAGKHQIDKPLKIPSGFSVEINHGVELDLVNGAYIYSNSPLTCTGTEEYPIKFYSSDGTGAGIFINKTDKISILNNCIFSNLSNPTTDAWELSGAVNFHEADVRITNTTFEKNRCEDALNIIRSNFMIDNTMFSETFSDAFDGDFVTGTISNTKFVNSGNDGIDVSGSQLTIANITIENPSDKAISAGEASHIEGSQIFVFGGEIGIVSKDLSTIKLDVVSLKDTRLGLSAFQKKTEYGTGTIEITNLALINIEVEHLIEIGSMLTIDGVSTKTVSNNVIDQMYGNEYGKSSK